MLCQGCAPIPTRTLTHFASPWRTKQFTDPVSDAGAQCWPDDEANERACSDCCGRSGGLRPSERGKRAARVTRGGRFKVSHYPQEERGGRRPRRTTESPRHGSAPSELGVVRHRPNRSRASCPRAAPSEPAARRPSVLRVILKMPRRGERRLLHRMTHLPVFPSCSMTEARLPALPLAGAGGVGRMPGRA